MMHIAGAFSNLVSFVHVSLWGVSPVCVLAFGASHRAEILRRKEQGVERSDCWAGCPVGTHVLGNWTNQRIRLGMVENRQPYKRRSAKGLPILTPGPRRCVQTDLELSSKRGGDQKRDRFRRIQKKTCFLPPT